MIPADKNHVDPFAEKVPEVTETQQCPNCIWDEVNKCGSGVYNGTGTSPFAGNTCPVCNNAGVLVTPQSLTLPAIVQWSRIGKGDFNTPVAAGSIPYGHARIKVLSQFHSNLLQATSFVVDGIRCQKVGQPIKRGLQSYIISELMVRRDD